MTIDGNDHLFPNVDYVVSATGVVKPILDFPKHLESQASSSAKQPLHEEDPMRQHFGFTEKSIRLAFIRKVYSILMMQLLISAAFIAFFKYNEGSKEFIYAHPESLLISIIVTLVLVVSMSCCVTARRVPPLNYICLFMFTLAESFLLGAVCVTRDSAEVLLAVGICAVVCFSLTVFAFQTKYDFTTWGTGLYVALIILVTFGLVLMLVPIKINPFRLVYAGFGCLLFSFYLIYNTQLLIGGTHKYSVSPEEYVFAALNLYLDIVQLFLMILRLVSGGRGG